MTTKKYQGGCLCGNVRFEIIGNIKNIVFCHCTQCRKAQGSAFATNGNIDKNDFKFTAGEDQLTAYQEGHLTKFFCQQCGSPIISKNTAYPNTVRIRLGAIETPITEKPEAHIFTTSKADWDDICDDLPQYESYEPDR